MINWLYAKEKYPQLKANLLRYICHIAIAHQYSFSQHVLNTYLVPGRGHIRPYKTGLYHQGSSSEGFRNKKECYRMTQQCPSSLFGKNPQSIYRKGIYTTQYSLKMKYHMPITCIYIQFYSVIVEGPIGGLYLMGWGRMNNHFHCFLDPYSLHRYDTQIYNVYNTRHREHTQ